MDPYKNLISNTVLFGVSTFGARFLTFLLTPFYTRVLSSAEYGVTDLLLQTGNLIIPIASVGIANAVIRYGLEQASNKSGVFTTGIAATLSGFSSCCCSPLFWDGSNSSPAIFGWCCSMCWLPMSTPSATSLPEPWDISASLRRMASYAPS